MPLTVVRSCRSRRCVKTRERSSRSLVTWTLLSIFLTLTWSPLHVLAQEPATVTPAPEVTSVPSPPPPPSPSPVPAESPAAPAFVPTVVPAPSTVAPTPAAPGPTATPVPVATLLATLEPTAKPTPAPAPAPAPTVAPALTLNVTTGNSSNDTIETPTPTKKRTKAPTELLTLAPSDETPEPTAKTPTPTPTSVPASDGVDNSTNSSGNKNKHNRTIIMAVVAGIAGLCVIALLACCCQRRRRNRDSIMTPTPMPILATNSQRQQPLQHYQQQQQYHPSFGGMDHAPGQLRDSKPSLNTAGYGGLSTAENGLPQYAITSPDMPTGYRATANQSRLVDFHRHTRSGNASAVTSPTSALSHTASAPSASFSNALRATNASSAFDARSDSESSSFTLDRESYSSQLSSNDMDGSVRSTTARSERFTSRSSTLSYAMRDTDTSDVASFLEHSDSASSIGPDAGRGAPLRSSKDEPRTGKSWYKSIGSPSEQDRYTANLDRSTLERESFEL